jgi:hypothetical protein
MGCSKQKHPENGVYVSPREVAAVHLEVLELKDGKYRYWMLGDVGPQEPLKLAGDYRFENGRILMHGDHTPPFDREFLSRQNTTRLLRFDATQVRRKEEKLYPYGTLTRVPYAFEEVGAPDDANKKWLDILLPKLPILKDEG